VETLNGHQRDLTAQITRSIKKKKSAKGMLEEWEQQHNFAFERHVKMISELKARQSIDFAMLSVAVAGAGSLVVSKSE